MKVLLIIFHRPKGPSSPLQMETFVIKESGLKLKVIITSLIMVKSALSL